MPKHTIPQLNQTLQQLSTFFQEKSVSFCKQINLHESRFTAQDYAEFRNVVEDIKIYATKEIRAFFQKKISEKSDPYESKISSFSEQSTSTCTYLRQFQEELEQSTIELKANQNRKEELLEHISSKYHRDLTLKKFWGILKKNAQQKRGQKLVNEEMTKIYQYNLLKKSFFPWRRLTYKEGYENTVKRETSNDLMQIHGQYQSIIDIMKEKIADADAMIKVKKAAKGEFAYALSKNLLKTISNLSLEVMSLNQMSLNDGEVSELETKKFMKSVDEVISEKLKKVRDLKNHMIGQDESSPMGREKKKKITFA